MIFVYKTTNLLNGKIYVGVHEGEENDTYLGSGRAILAAIKKYGEENFAREIIKICDSAEEAFAVEAEIVNEEFVKNDQTYNMTTGGKGGWYHAIKRGDDNWTRRPGASKIISDAVKKGTTSELRALRAERMRQMRSDGTVVKPTGWSHTEEAKRKISESLIGQSPWNKGIKTGPDSIEIRQKKSDAAKRRSRNMDMGALTRGKLRKPSVTCVKCRRTMYLASFETHQRGKCWKT